MQEKAIGSLSLPPATVAYIKKAVDQAPPFTSEQRNRLAELLAPVRRSSATGTRR